MPREMAAGRPGSQMIPADWSEQMSHVAESAFTSKCRVTLPSTETTWDNANNRSVPVAGATVYEGPCRVQVLANAPAVNKTADQPVTTQAYLVALPASVATVEVGCLVEVTKSTADATLTDGRRLRVEAVQRGSEIWQRDLICFDDLD